MIIANSASDLPLIWYHGTTEIDSYSILNGIDLNRPEARKDVDFGKGFYLTTNEKRAERRAIGKALSYNFEQDQQERPAFTTPEYTKPVVIQYRLDTEGLGMLKGKFFTKAEDDWILFVLGNRSAHPERIKGAYHNQKPTYDFVYGPLADGTRIPIQIIKVERGTMLRSEFLEEARRYPFPKENQLSVHTRAAVSLLVPMEVKVCDTLPTK